MNKYNFIAMLIGSFCIFAALVMLRAIFEHPDIKPLRFIDASAMMFLGITMFITVITRAKYFTVFVLLGLVTAATVVSCALKLMLGYDNEGANTVGLLFNTIVGLWIGRRAWDVRPGLTPDQFPRNDTLLFAFLDHLRDLEIAMKRGLRDQEPFEFWAHINELARTSNDFGAELAKRDPVFAAHYEPIDIKEL